MAKINLKVFKKGKPIYWIIGAVFLFVVFYLLFNSGGKAANAGAGGMQVVNTGPSEAMQMAALQASSAINAAQIGANVEALRIQSEEDAAALGAQVALAQLSSGENVALSELALQKDLAVLNTQTNLLINEQNVSYSLETARVAAETDLARRALDTGLLAHQLDVNAEMFAEQSRSLAQQALISQVSNLKKKNRDEMLAHLASLNAGQESQYVAQKGGGFNPLKIISPITNAI